MENSVENWEFTDSKIRDEYDTQNARKPEDFKNMVEEADSFRNSADTAEKTKAACIYIVLAQKGYETSELNPIKLFHFAGNLLRGLNKLKRSAQAYENSAIIGLEKLKNKGSEIDKKLIEMALRSSGRAKNIYLEIGDLIESDRCHVIQHDLKSLDYKYKKIMRFHLQIWRKTSIYGTSPKEWLKSYLKFTVFFTILYQFIFILCPDSFSFPKYSIEDNYVLTPLYYTLVTGTTLGFGDILPASILAQLVTLANLVIGWILLATGATFLTRK